MGLEIITQLGYTTTPVVTIGAARTDHLYTVQADYGTWSEFTSR